MKEHLPRYTGRGDGKSSQGQERRDVGIPPVEEPSHSQDIFFYPMLSRKEAMGPQLAGLWSTVVRQKAQGLSILVIWTRSCTHTGSRDSLGHHYPCSIQLIPPSQSVKGTQARPKFRVLQAT